MVPVGDLETIFAELLMPLDVFFSCDTFLEEGELHPETEAGKDGTGIGTANTGVYETYLWTGTPSACRVTGPSTGGTGHRQAEHLRCCAGVDVLRKL